MSTLLQKLMKIKESELREKSCLDYTECLSCLQSPSRISIKMWLFVCVCALFFDFQFLVSFFSTKRKEHTQGQECCIGAKVVAKIFLASNSLLSPLDYVFS